MARTDLLSGQVQLTVDGLLPDLPTMEKAGVRGYQSDTWYALLVPAATPRSPS